MVKNIGYCPFCAGRISLILGLGGDTLFRHTPNRLCPVRNTARFTTEKEARDFWKREKAAKGSCRSCQNKEKEIKKLKNAVGITYESISTIRDKASKLGLDEVTRISEEVIRMLEEVV